MNYLKEIMKDASKNIFEHFSDLEIDEQPFIIFIDYNNNDFEYKIYDMKKTNNPFEELKNIYYENLIKEKELEIIINLSFRRNEEEKMRDLIKMVERKKASGDDFEIKINDKSLYKIIYGEYNVELNEALKSFEKERLNDDFNVSIINFNTSIDLPKEINDLKNLEILEDNIKLRIYKNSKEKFIIYKQLS